jgi:hypothetical protein
MPYDGASLTGSLVQELRTRHKLSRAKFSELAGLSGKSTARLYNIEVNDQWKPGDRDRVATLLTQLELGALPTDVRVVVRPGMPIHPATVDTPAGPSVIPLPEDPDDLVDALATVLPTNGVAGVSEATQDSSGHVADDLLSDALLTEPDGVYRVSNSELQTFKRCRRKWWLAWYQRLMLQTEDFTSVRATGTRVHRALAYWYVPDGEKRVDPRDALERVIVDDWTKVAKLAQERRTSDEQLGELAVEFAQATNLERAMVEGYVQWLEETGADAELRITASETPLVVDEVVDMGGTYNHEQREIQFIGLLDVRATRVTDNVNLFIDHKTVGDLTAPVVTLPQNEQMLHYHLMEFLSLDDSDVRCDGALYNMLRRVKRSARAKPPFYDRIEVRHNKFELESYRRRALAATREILVAIDRLERGEEHVDVVYPTPNPTCRWDCDFFAVCNLLDDGSRGVNDMINALYRKINPLERYRKQVEK